VSAEWRKEAFPADDRLELPNETKRTTEERPLDGLLFFNVNVVLKTFFLLGSLYSGACWSREIFAQMIE
jgi:hypothetical protein